ncbi:UNVERIFIED_CONTAM: LOB domain-containing protein 39 [Sesamum angustifolium]|uniref:LOB domain-containing protein 39 n=1 Tax=Sesamum angustifolium TaxID=2727405 RepID=A0AAW2NLH3_9LAMI
MSCNGCRIRKGCSETCILRPCVQWIESAEAQGHATVFVAKFFGRAGLMSFISAVPENQRPALFQSLLFEAAGKNSQPRERGGGASVDRKLAHPSLSPRPKVQKRRRFPDEPAKVMQLADLDLSLTPGFQGKKMSPSAEKRRLGSPSMNSEESLMTTCGDHHPATEIKILNLFN